MSSYQARQKYCFSADTPNFIRKLQEKPAVALVDDVKNVPIVTVESEQPSFIIESGSGITETEANLYLGIKAVETIASDIGKRKATNDLIDDVKPMKQSKIQSVGAMKSGKKSSFSSTRSVKSVKNSKLLSFSEEDE